MPTIYRNDAKQKLAKLWGLSSAGLIVFLAILTFGGEGITDQQEYWSWFLPHIVPGIGLIMSVIIIEANNPPKNIKIGKFYFHFAFGFSAFYFLLLALFMIIVVLPNAMCFEETCTKLFKSRIAEKFNHYGRFDTFNLIAGTLSGFVIGALGMFFIKKVD